MSQEDWRYEWIKTLSRKGIPVETAQSAFKMLYGGIDGVDTFRDPVTEAEKQSKNWK